MTESALLATLSSRFTWVDWAVVAAYLAFTTILGAKLAGRQSSMRDFFLGGRKLPWYAVSGSIIATEISALTFVSVPSIVFKMDVEGNFKYLQLGIIGSFLARIVVGYVLVPAYYSREIYSPYDYMGNQLGGSVRSMTSVLFSLGGILGQSARVYLTAEVLMVVMADQLKGLESWSGIPALGWAIILIGVVSVGWTLMGGITTVIWTDVILFLVFLVGAFVALGTVAAHLSGGFGEMFRIGWEAQDQSNPWGKFTFFDFSHSPTRQYTIWTAAIASTWGGLGAYGTDQLLAQRMFCCKNTRDARWAIISSTASQIVTVTVMLVGVGLYAYYKQTPEPTAPAEFLSAAAHPDFPMLRGEALTKYNESPDMVFPIFILERIPQGLKGLIIAAIFAAAISSLMGILTALSQVVMSAFYNPWRELQLRRRGIAVQLSGNIEELAEGATSAEDRRSVIVGRLMVLFWGVALCAMAYLAKQIGEHYKSILDLALAMVGFTQGALLAGFALAFLPLGITGRGFMYSRRYPSFAFSRLVWHYDWTHKVCWAAGIAIMLCWIVFRVRDVLVAPPASRSSVPRDLLQTVFLAVGIGLMLWLNYRGYLGEKVAEDKVTFTTVAWPWYVPLGSTVAFVWGWLLATRKPAQYSAS